MFQHAALANTVNCHCWLFNVAVESKGRSAFVLVLDYLPSKIFALHQQCKLYNKRVVSNFGNGNLLTRRDVAQREQRKFGNF